MKERHVGAVERRMARADDGSFIVQLVLVCVCDNKLIIYNENEAVVVFMTSWDSNPISNAII